MPSPQAEYITVIGAFWRHLVPCRTNRDNPFANHGLEWRKHFENYHRVLNRAMWSSREARHILFGLLISAFPISGPIVMGLDYTIERRGGAKIKAKGIYCDSVCSSHNHLVIASSLRWLSLMLLAPIPWAKRVWALRSLEVLVPSKRFY